MDKSARRRVNYRLLRAAGFTAEEATKFKDFNDKVVKELCEFKTIHLRLKKTLDSYYHKSLIKICGGDSNGA